MMEGGENDIQRVIHYSRKILTNHDGGTRWNCPENYVKNHIPCQIYTSQIYTIVNMNRKDVFTS